MTFSVTVIDSNHCPGGVCFLFEGYFGRILCTGDFRYKDGLFNGFDVYNVDRLYLDDTYNDPRYPRFLTTNEAVKEILNVINMNPNSKFMIAVDTLGKESLFVELAKFTKSLIIVNKTRYKRLQLLENSVNFNCNNIDKYFTINQSNGFIYMVNKRELTLTNLDRLNEIAIKVHNNIDTQLNETQKVNLKSDPSLLLPFVGIVPSGFCVRTSCKLKTSDNGSKQYLIPYSLHSSFNELNECIKYIKPKCIIPIVSNTNSKCYKYFRKYMSKDKKRKVVVPDIIQDILNGNRNPVQIAINHLGNPIRKIGQRKKESSLVRARKFARKKMMNFQDKSNNNSNNGKNRKNNNILEEKSNLVNSLLDDDNECEIISYKKRKKSKVKDVIEIESTSSSELNDIENDESYSSEVIIPPKKKRKLCHNRYKTKRGNMLEDSLLYDDGNDGDNESEIEYKNDNEWNKKIFKSPIVLSKKQRKRKYFDMETHKRNDKNNNNNSNNNININLIDSIQNGNEFMATLSGTDGNNESDKDMLNALINEMTQLNTQITHISSQNTTLNDTINDPLNNDIIDLT